MESNHPVFQEMVIGIDVLNVKDGISLMKMLARRDDLARNLVCVDEAPKSVAAVDTQYVVFADLVAKNQSDGGGTLIRQNTINNRSGSVPGNDYGDLLTRQAPGLGLPTTPTGRARETALPFERFKEISFVCLDNPFKFRGGILLDSSKKAMTPTKRRRYANAANHKNHCPAGTV